MMSNLFSPLQRATAVRVGDGEQCFFFVFVVVVFSFCFIDGRCGLFSGTMLNIVSIKTISLDRVFLFCYCFFFFVFFFCIVSFRCFISSVCKNNHLSCFRQNFENK